MNGPKAPAHFHGKGQNGIAGQKISMLPEKYSSNPTDTQNIGLRSGGVVGRLRVNSWLMNKNRTYAPDPPVSPSGALHR